MTAGPGRQPAAQRGELEALREVSQRQSVGTQLVLQQGAEGPGLDPGGPPGRIDLQDPVHGGQVHGQHGAVGVAPVLHAARHRRAAAERDDRDAVFAGPLQQVGDLAVVLGVGDEVGDAAGAAVQGADHVAVGLAHGVRGPHPGVGGDRVRQAAGGFHGGAFDAQVGYPGHGERSGEGAGQQGAHGGALGVVGVGIGPPPAPPGAGAGGGVRRRPGGAGHGGSKGSRELTWR